jgi:putative NADH-flavin reductase
MNAISACRALRIVAALASLLTLLPAVAQERATEPLEILVYGATGKIGSLVVTEALERGHHVTAVSREPSQIELRHAGLTAAKGDLLDAASVAGLLTGKDVVIVSVRGVIGDSKSPENALQRIAVERIVTALRQMDGERPRLIHVGGAGSLEVEPGVLYVEKIPKIFIPKRLEIEMAGQVLALDYLRGIDDVEWTYVTPPRNFTNGERTGRYRIGGDRLIEDARGRSRISRADFAVALLDEAESGAHVGERIAVAY